MESWSQEFVRNASELGIGLSASKGDDWHIDGIDKKTVAFFAVLWGSYLNALPKGGMGNLLVYPGTHHSIAHMFRTEGSESFFARLDGKKPYETVHCLKRAGIADGKPYELLV